MPIAPAHGTRLQLIETGDSPGGRDDKVALPGSEVQPWPTRIYAGCLCRTMVLISRQVPIEACFCRSHGRRFIAVSSGGAGEHACPGRPARVLGGSNEAVADPDSGRHRWLRHGSEVTARRVCLQEPGNRSGTRVRNRPRTAMRRDRGPRHSSNRLLRRRRAGRATFLGPDRRRENVALLLPVSDHGHLSNKPISVQADTGTMATVNVRNATTSPFIANIGG